MVSLEEFFKKVDFEKKKSVDQKKSSENYLACKELNYLLAAIVGVIAMDTCRTHQIDESKITDN